MCEFMGTLAAVLFIAANAYYPARVIAKNYLPRSRGVRSFFKRYLRLHIFLNLLALWALLVHDYYADERNIILLASMLATLWLIVVGLMMHYHFSKIARKHLRLLHTQQFMFFVWIVLIVVGHSTL